MSQLRRLGYTTPGRKGGAESDDNRAVILLSRMALVALIVGTSVTVSATERVDASLVLSGFAGWAFVPVAQLLTGLLLVRGSGPRTIAALERYFATHWPWSLWILAAHGVFLIVPASRGYGLWIMLTAAVPVLWTVRLLLQLCRETLGLSLAEARKRVVAHQAATVTIAVGYVSVAVALWPRIIGLLA